MADAPGTTLDATPSDQYSAWLCIGTAAAATGPQLLEFNTSLSIKSGVCSGYAAVAARYCVADGNPECHDWPVSAQVALATIAARQDRWSRTVASLDGRSSAPGNGGLNEEAANVATVGQQTESCGALTATITADTNCSNHRARVKISFSRGPWFANRG